MEWVAGSEGMVGLGLSDVLQGDRTLYVEKKLMKHVQTALYI
jgi:hypothetical protein